MGEDIIDSLRTLAGDACHEIKIKGSRFIALGHHAETESAAINTLDDIRKREHAATHHCFAYVIGVGGALFKYSDDGEPNGTAGRPIHQAIMSKGLTDVLVVVVRYFGGTKLGTGGLTRAYARAASELLDKAPIVEKLICDRLTFTVPFSLYDRVMRIISSGGYRIIDQDFAEQVAMIVDVRKSHTEESISKMTELTGGRIEIAVND
jgi:uncharacterized YigZ family protein